VIIITPDRDENGDGKCVLLACMTYINDTYGQSAIPMEGR